MFAAASKSGRAGSATPTTDASFAYVPLLLETGSASSLNTTVTDSSASPNTVTRVSNPSTGWVSPYQTDGYWGNYFNGTNAYLSVASNAALQLGTGDFTVEFWIYPITLPGAATYPPMLVLGAGTANTLFVNFRGSGTIGLTDDVAVYATTASPLVVNNWYHIAVVRSSGSSKIYTNGVGGTAVACSTNFSQNFATIGYNLISAYLNAYISNLRIVKGTAVYTGNFTPSTAPLTAITNTSLLTCQSSRFKDNSTNAFTITSNGTPQVDPYFYPSGFTAPAASLGAVLLNGSSQFLKSTTATTAFQFGTNPYTVECWLYQPSRPARQYVCGGSFSGTGFQIFMDSGLLRCSATGIGDLPAATIAVPLNAWTHIAVVRTSTSAGGVAYYVNGVPAGTNTMSADISGTASYIDVGTSADSTAEPTIGYIANFRAVKGTAVYTGAFTPPSGPLTQTGGTYPSLTNVVTGFSAANTSLLLNLADSNYLSATDGVRNNTFIDESNYAFPVTRNGTPTQGSYTPYWPNGQWSNLFAASGDYLSVPDAANLELGASDFQMSAWVYLTAYPVSNAGSYSSSVLSKGTFAGTRSYEFGIGGASGTALGLSLTNAGATTTNITGSFSFALNTWYAVRATRVSNRVYLFVNGTLLNAGGTAYTDTVSNGTDTLKVGRSNLDATYLFQFFGYISNVSLAIGGTGYSTASYTPATIPTTTVTSDIKFLSCQSNRFVDNSSVPATITVTGTPRVQAFQPFSPTASYTTALYGGSGYFNGSTDYVSITDGTALKLGSGNFTIEGWVYLSSSGGSQAIYARSGFGIIIGVGSGTFVLFASSNGSSWDLASGTTFGTAVANTWMHFAAVRNGASITLYLNGVLGNTVAVSTSTLYEATAPTVGNWNYAGANWWLNGYASNLRVVKGTAVYTGAFTPPTLAPLSISGPTSAASYSSTTNVNTTFLTPASLLLNMTNAGIYDAAVQNDMVTGGTTQASSTITPKWGTTSMKFNGATTDYLYAPVNSADTFGSGNWTIEGWFNFSSVSGNQEMFSKESLNAAQSGIRCVLTSSRVQFQLSSNGSTYATTVSCSTALTTGVWYYLAFVRNGTAITVYLNGTSDGSGSFTGALYETNTFWALASRGLYSAGTSYNGYIQDFRITKGVARTITTPTAAFPTR